MLLFLTFLIPFFPFNLFYLICLIILGLTQFHQRKAILSTGILIPFWKICWNRNVWTNSMKEWTSVLQCDIVSRKVIDTQICSNVIFASKCCLNPNCNMSKNYTVRQDPSLILEFWIKYIQYVCNIYVYIALRWQSYSDMMPQFLNFSTYENVKSTCRQFPRRRF